MKVSLMILLLSLITILAYPQKPKNGTYTYNVAFEEYAGKTLGATCTVIIHGDSIKLIHNGKANLTGKKGDILEEGIIMKHKKTGKWIIGHTPNDVNAKELNDCDGGPTIIDFKNKIWMSC